MTHTRGAHGYALARRQRLVHFKPPAVNRPVSRGCEERNGPPFDAGLGLDQAGTAHSEGPSASGRPSRPAGIHAGAAARSPAVQ